jgi:hypothetical protein
LVICLFVAGCNRGGLNLAEVEGVVTFNGAPVADAGILFQPDSGPFAIGMTDSDGRFTLTTANRPGALVGDHRVSISKSQTIATQVPGERFPRYAMKHSIPEKYASPATSELTATVTDDEDENQFKFELAGNVGA